MIFGREEAKLLRFLNIQFMLIYQYKMEFSLRLQKLSLVAYLRRMCSKKLVVGECVEDYF